LRKQNKAHPLKRMKEIYLQIALHVAGLFYVIKTCQVFKNLTGFLQAT
jgi:hypothetical protein